MLKSNFSKRLTDQFEESFEEVLNLTKNKNYDKALQLIDGTFSNLFRLNSLFFNSMSNDNLVDILKVGGEIEKDKAIVISKLLEQRACILNIQGKENESFYIYIKALNLFIEAFLCDKDTDLDKYFKDIPNMIEKTSGYVLPEETSRRIVNYYKEVGDFASAEDYLYELLDVTEKNTESIAFALEFYDSLLKLDDETLEKGNLSREEILEVKNFFSQK
ncbi:tetratricopeptide (TPR) repeat protein [Clostridium pascui]|uniref:DUF6483 family protein n=1 Tax=Clostridium pascui TaxID=46609 RepID=UPI00195B9FFF|nr:DUF6483 family protein [Clostridium pascui]MBM7871155.1 tetratricopeptide (TPR) repeat protein [Clostridium pascui]